MKRILFITLILTAFTSFAKKFKSEPKLIIVITIDNFSEETIYKFSDLLDDDGFRLYCNNGLIFKNIKPNYSFSSSLSILSSIFTGATANEHKIIEEMQLKRGTYAKQNVFDDSNAKTVGIDNAITSYSPKALYPSTVFDELLINKKYSKGYSVSLKAENAIIGGGHLTNGVYWFNEDEGKWTTSTFYSFQLPDYINKYNDTACYRKKDYTFTWKPLHSVKLYTETNPDNVSFESDVQMAYSKELNSDVANKSKAFSRLCYSPDGNRIVTDLALGILKNEKLGEDRHPDIMHINYTSLDLIASLFGIHSTKYQDAFLRLDKEIARLNRYIIDNIGFKNTLVVLTSSKPTFYNDIDFQKFSKLQGGQLNMNRVTTIVNLYLTKKFNERLLIEGFSGNSIFINNERINNKNLNHQLVIDETIKFLKEFSGVSNAYDKKQILSNVADIDLLPKEVKSAFKEDNVGDILIMPLPGWIINLSDDNNYFPKIAANNQLPLIMFGWEVESDYSFEQGSEIDIAPTISSFLHIASPNKSEGKVLIVKPSK